MNYIAEIKSVFSQSTITVSERVKCVDISFETTSLPPYDSICELLKKFPLRDTIRLLIFDESDEKIVFGNNIITETTQYERFVSEVELSDYLSVKIYIEKEVFDNTFSIYCFDEFSKDICTLGLLGTLSVFSNLLNGLEYLNFVVYDQKTNFMTKTMCFSSGEIEEFSDNFSRTKRYNDCQDVSRFSSFKKFYIIPEDFKIIINSTNNPFADIFNRLNTLLSLIFISNSASLDNSMLSLQITGQRSVSYDIDINKIKANNELYKIYNWIFNEGNATDKAIIARNVLSLHCKYTDLTNIDELAFASIQSNYNLYLRHNVEHYLELKNKVAEYICEIVAKTSEYATTVADKFKQNLIALIGFILTTILANIVSSNPLNNIFTRDITRLVYAILLGSIVFWIISIIETNYNTKKIKEAYYLLKENYKPVLSQDDVEEIFKKDELFSKTEKEIRDKKIFFSFLWITFIICSFFIIETLSDAPILIDHIPQWITHLKNLLFKNRY